MSWLKNFYSKTEQTFFVAENIISETKGRFFFILGSDITKIDQKLLNSSVSGTEVWEQIGSYQRSSCTWDYWGLLFFGFIFSTGLIYLLRIY
jgi:hypothetical protein